MFITLLLLVKIARDNLLIKEVQVKINNGTNSLIAYYYNETYLMVDKVMVFLLKRLII
jgi:hypothetical protein